MEEILTVLGDLVAIDEDVGYSAMSAYKGVRAGSDIAFEGNLPGGRPIPFYRQLPSVIRNRALDETRMVPYDRTLAQQLITTYGAEGALSAALIGATASGGAIAAFQKAYKILHETHKSAVKFIKGSGILHLLPDSALPAEHQSVVDHKAKRIKIRHHSPMRAPGCPAYKDTFIISGTITGAGTISRTATVIAQGNDFDERDGQDIIIHQIVTRTVYVLPRVLQDPLAAVNDSIRIIIFIDHNANNAPLVSDVLETAAGTHINTWFKYENRARFLIIYDHTITMHRTAATSGVGAGDWFPETNATRTVQLDVKVPMHFAGADGTAPTSNNIGALAISKNGVVQIDLHMRIKFDN